LLVDRLVDRSNCYSQAPDSQAPDSQAPDSQAPDSQAPDSQAPDSQAPDSQVAAAAEEQCQPRQYSLEKLLLKHKEEFVLLDAWIPHFK
jgi:hypothetical protein